MCGDGVMRWAGSPREKCGMSVFCHGRLHGEKNRNVLKLLLMMKNWKLSLGLGWNVIFSCCP